MVLLWRAAIVGFSLSLLGFVVAHARTFVSPLWLIPEYVGLQFTENPGVAFGVTLPGFPPLLLTLLIFFVLLVVLSIALSSPRSFWSDAGFGLVLGGGLANIVDRLRDGFVTDFLVLWPIPTFNVADTCITVGILLLCTDALSRRYRG